VVIDPSAVPAETPMEIAMVANTTTAGFALQ